jgi:hypothetical protein
MYGLQITVYKMSSHELIPLKKIILEEVKGQHLDKKFPHLTWNLVVLYRFHKSLLRVPDLCQILPVHVFTSSYLCLFPPCAFIQGFPQLLGGEYKSCVSALYDFLQPLSTPFYG